MKRNPSGGLAPACTAAPRARTGTSTIVLGELIDRFLGMDVEDASANFEALANLIGHHPGYRREARAMRRLVEARDTLAATTHEAQNL
jgi:hypothetical protein